VSDAGFLDSYVVYDEAVRFTCRESARFIGNAVLVKLTAVFEGIEG
jgi:hypothetical protein